MFTFLVLFCPIRREPHPLLEGGSGVQVPLCEAPAPGQRQGQEHQASWAFTVQLFTCSEHHQESPVLVLVRL